jgi:hypothetical protein
MFGLKRSLSVALRVTRKDSPKGNDWPRQYALTLGFGTNWRAPSFLCRLLGRHTRVTVIHQHGGGWSVHADCCNIAGWYSEPRPAPRRPAWTEADEANERQLYSANKLAFWLAPARDFSTLTFEDKPMDGLKILGALRGERPTPPPMRVINHARPPAARAKVVGNFMDALK